MTLSAPLLETLQRAVAAHQSGKAAQAERLYKRVLNQDPNQPDALNLLGVLMADKGDTKQAIALFDRAIAAAPHLATVPFNKGNALSNAERLTEARAAYEQALACDPAFHDARLNLGVLLQKSGDTEEALQHFIDLIQRAPNNHANVQKAHYNIGKCHQDRGQLEDAEAALLTALSLNPNDPDAHFAIANIYADTRRHQNAIDHINNAIQLKPAWAEAYSLLGLMLSRLQHYDAAIDASKKAFELKQDSGSIHLNLAMVYYAAGETEAAKAALNRATTSVEANADALVTLANIAKKDLDPWGALDLLEQAHGAAASATTLNNIGAMLRDLDLNMMALAFYEAAHHEDSKHVVAARSFGTLKLRLGQLEDGWRLNKIRLEDPNFKRARHNSPPFWQGEDLQDKRLHIFLEEGIGDQVLQSSFIQEMIDQAKHCSIECNERLAPIAQRSFPTAHVVEERNIAAIQKSLVESDFQCPALELGSHLRKSFDAFPKERRAFLRPDPELVAHYQKKYENLADGRKIVGLAWSSRSPGYGKYKTLDLTALQPLLDSQNVFPISLQYGDMASSMEALTQDTGLSIYVDDSINQLQTLETFFAQVAALDLVMTISNTTAHIAGAVGTPTWVMLPRGAGALWYWFVDREDSPWYPSVRLFRQKSRPSLDKPWWPEVVEDVAAALQSWLAEVPS